MVIFQLIGTNSSTTQDWLKASEGMRITAYDPSVRISQDTQLVEPDQAVALPPAERERMNRARQGVRTPPNIV